MTAAPAKQSKRTRNIKGKSSNAAVLEAATRLFAERGYDGVSIADVAAASGVAKPSVLYHFSDKENLWKTVVETLWAEVDAFFDARWPRSIPPSRELLEKILDLFIEASTTWPAYVRIPFIEGATPSWRSEWLVDRHFKQHVLTTDRILRSMQRRGLIGTGDPAHYQAMLTSSINVFVAQNAMWSRSYSRDLGGADSLRTAMRLILDLMVQSPLSDRTDK